MRKFPTLEYFLTQDQIHQCIKLKETHLIKDRIVLPNIDLIEKKLNKLLDEEQADLISNCIVHALRTEGVI